MVALSIAGFDPTGEAGLLRDVSVFSSMGLTFHAVPTALTIQSTLKVFDTMPVPIEYIKIALQKIDKRIDGVKIGMLYNEEVVRIVADFLKGWRPIYVVLDPVIKSSSGYALISQGGLKALLDLLLPLSTFVTPNVEEGRILTSEREPLKIARRLHSLGAKNIVITGIDGKDDYFFDGEESTLIKGNPIDFSLHGSGCFYSSCLLGRLLLGDTPLKALKNTKRAIENLGEQS
ncbi:hydroxymethylpyrimidine/phosphomethylpyrimidine kinase [candidate division WOR-3 bacterium]|nr:hydroxymethylpyrimidine/phosphomethylpyrimidine kinase [candidate division WOR-3 bacterium]